MRRIAVRGIAVLDGKLLCVKLKGYGGKDARNFWCLPGGGLDEGESLEDGLIREIVEETSVKPEVGKLLYIQQFIFEGLEQFEFFFHITNAEDYMEINLSHATHAAEEIAEIDFVDPASTDILPEFLTKEDIAGHVASRSPAKIFNYL